MGCFSFMCKECGKAILSDSFSGQEVKLFLLKDGKVIQEMEGQYDSYGRVFDNEMNTVYWNDPNPDTPLKGDKEEDTEIWHRVCDLMFKPDKSNGIAAIHSKCYRECVPVTRSEDDPNQGWGDPDREDEEY